MPLVQAIQEDSGSRRSTRSPAAEVRGVSKVFTKGTDRVVAVGEMDFVVGDEEFVALVGPSGCGKTTMLRMLGGLTRPTSGTVEVGSVRVDGPRHDIGFMLQHPTLLPWRTVMNNVLLPIEILRKPTAQDRAKAQGLIELVGLQKFTTHYPRELSGGMQQRAALCRVLMTDPTIMLLDEPFGAIDEFTRERLNVELANIVRESRRSAVLVTHNISEAVFLADRVIAMGTHPGRTVGEVKVAFARPRPVSITSTPEFQEVVREVREVLGLA